MLQRLGNAPLLTEQDGVLMRELLGVVIRAAASAIAVPSAAMIHGKRASKLPPRSRRGVMTMSSDLSPNGTLCEAVRPPNRGLAVLAAKRWSASGAEPR